MVKKIKLIVFCLLLILITSFETIVYAINQDITISGDDTAEAGETKKIIVNVTSDKTIGVVSGIIEYSSNIESVKVEGKNNWNLTYNDKTGDFNIYKAVGSNSEDIIEIEYKIKSDATDTATITLSSLNETSIKYETVEVEPIVKSITIGSQKNSEIISKSSLPFTCGKGLIIIIGIIAILVITIIIIKKYKKYKGS